MKVRFKNSLCYSCSLVITIVSLGHAQGWQWQNPLPQGNRLGEVQFVDSLYGWIRSDGATILRTTDGGETWSAEGIERWTQKIYFVDRLNGWAVGSGAPPFIVRTRDGGKTWENLPIPAERNKEGEYYNFYGLHFLDTLNGYITDDLAGIFHTNDGGQTWEKQPTRVRPPREIHSIFFVDSLKGFAVGAIPFLLYTKDGGRTWSHDSTIVGGFKVSFIDSLHGWILHPNSIDRTEDGGVTWTEYAVPPAGEGHIDFMFLNSQQGWMAGGRGMSMTTDGGKTWTRLDSSFSYSGVFFINSTHGLASGGGSLAAGGSISNQFFETLDGGRTWQSKTTSVTNQRLWGVDFIDEMTGWAVGVDGTILHTTDGGKTWVHQSSPSISWLKKVTFLDKNTGWIVGYGGTILHTTNGGQTWQRQASGTTYALVEASFVSKQKGWVVGWSLDTDPVSGIVLHTNNGGVTWQNQTPTGIGRLYGVAFIDSLRGWIATGGGRVDDIGGKLYRTQDGGRTWEIQIDKPGDAFARIVFVDSLHGWVAGYYNILRTQDGGRTWEIKAPAMRVEALTNMQFVDRHHGWAVGVRGDITHTIDGGETWMIQQSKTNLTLSDIDFVNERTGWAAGIFGTILHTETGGVTSVAELPNISSPPSGFELYQNYPNPFNTQTILSFRLNNSHARVTVEIYNPLGQLVTTLLDDHLAAGYHRVIWNGSDQNGKSVGSGVYLYQIRVDDQKKGGKMILLR